MALIDKVRAAVSDLGFDVQSIQDRGDLISIRVNDPKQIKPLFEFLDSNGFDARKKTDAVHVYQTGYTGKNMKTKQLPGIGTDESAGAGGVTTPLGAQILKRMHEDAGLLMQEYDSWMPSLEHDKVKAHLKSALEGLESLMSDTESLHSKHYKDLPPLGGDAAMEEGEDFETKDGDELPDEVEGDAEIETKDGDELPDEDVYDKDVDDPDAIAADSDKEEVPTPDEVVEGMETKDFEEEEFEVEGGEKSLRNVRRKALDGDDLTDDEKRLLRRAKAWHKSAEDEDEVDEKRLARTRRKAMDGEELDDDEKRLLRRAKGMRRKSACPECEASGKTDCDCGGKSLPRREKAKWSDGSGWKEGDSRAQRAAFARMREDGELESGKSLRNVRRKDMGGDPDDIDALDKDMETADEMLGDLEESKGFGLEPHEKEEVKEAAKYLKELIDEHNYNDDHRHKSYAFHRSFDKMCKKYGGKSADADVSGMDPMLEQKDMGEEADPNVAVLEQASKFFKALASEHAYGDGHRAEAAAHGKALEPLTLDEDKGFDDQTGDEFDDDFEVKAEDLPDVPDLDEEVKSEEMDPGYEPGEMGQKKGAVNRLKRLIVQQQKAMSDIGEKMKLIADRNGTSR